MNNACKSRDNLAKSQTFHQKKYALLQRDILSMKVLINNKLFVHSNGNPYFCCAQIILKL